MTTKITIDPALVRRVFEIGEVEIRIYDNEIVIMGDDEYPEESDKLLSALSEQIYGENYVYLDDDGNLQIDIHRFKDLAIEWCETKGYQIYVGGGEATIKSYGEILEIIGWTDEEDEYETRLSAELAAISFVWKQIQKEKKDEHH